MASHKPRKPRPRARKREIIYPAALVELTSLAGMRVGTQAPDGVAAAIEHARPLMRHRRPANPAATRRCHHPATPEASTRMLAALVTSALTPPHPRKLLVRAPGAVPASP
jgi:hypothetical protein